MSLRPQRLCGALPSLCLAAVLSGCSGGSSSPDTPTPSASAAAVTGPTSPASLPTSARPAAAPASGVALSTADAVAAAASAVQAQTQAQRQAATPASAEPRISPRPLARGPATVALAAAPAKPARAGRALPEALPASAASASSSPASSPSPDAQVAATASAESDQANLMRLLGTGSVWLQAVGAPLEVSDDQGRMLGSAAVCQTGSVSVTMGGTSLPVGATMRASGVLATRFTDCVNNGTRYSGRSTADYRLSSLAAPVNGSASVTLAGLRLVDVGGRTDYTVDGSASASMAGSLDDGRLTQTATLTPASGTSITNNLLSLSATLASGSLTASSTLRLSDNRLTASRISYSDFSFSVADTPYEAQGSLALLYDDVNGRPTSGSGEIKLSSKGQPVGRLYFGDGRLQIEVNGRVQSFSSTAAAKRP